MGHEFRNVNGYVAPALTVDAALMKGNEILLVKRGQEPFKGAWALPGGFVDPGETTEAAAVRELMEESGLKGEIVGLLGVWSDPERDPRGHTVTVVYPMKVAGIIPVYDAAAGDDAVEARWFSFDALPELAFDHADIARAAKAWLDAPGNLERLGDTDFGMCA